MDLYFSAAPGPSDWYIKWERCGGNRQSPINIDTTRVRERKYRTLKIEFDNSGGLVAGDLENNGNYPTFSVDKSKGTARLKGSRLTDTYVLKGFHVHFGCENDRGSEHTRNGRRYSGEVIRCYTRFLSKGEFLVIFLFRVFPQITKNSRFDLWKGPEAFHSVPMLSLDLCSNSNTHWQNFFFPSRFIFSLKIQVDDMQS